MGSGAVKSLMQDPAVVAARSLAVLWHSGQVRKYTGHPYVEHCERVAALLAAVTGDPELTAAGWLHDALEGTACPPNEIANLCGQRVAGLVVEVTDVSRPGDGNRAVRKALDRDHLAAASPGGKSVKLSDLVDNTISITAWDPDFARVYLTEKEELLPRLAGGDVDLMHMARVALSYAQKGLVRASLRSGAEP